MSGENYLGWVLRHTRTCWWHDSADPRELEQGLERGAVGATTNPFLCHLALAANRTLWAEAIQTALAASPEPEARAEALMRIPVTHAAGKLLPEFERSAGRQGYVCAQVNPSRAGDRHGMLQMARRFSAWAPNIAVKLPATAAGLDVLEDCVAEGIPVTATVSFTVPQVLAVGQRHQLGMARARARNLVPGRCFAVLMVGRLDDYLREVAADARIEMQPGDVEQAGIAVAKRSYEIFQQRKYEATLLIAALRGDYHMTELAGADLVMSIFPSRQDPLLSASLPREPRIDRPVSADVIARLSRLSEFVRAHEPAGMKPEEFITYGATQRTLAQFAEAGWRLMETMKRE